MDTLRGSFDSSDVSDESRDYDVTDDETGRELPPASIGQDERRMQVRAYNFWAGMLGDNNYPSIEDLEPAGNDDFGPFSVVLDFSAGIEDPAVQFLGDELAKECGSDGEIKRLSDVPPRSLLSRITDHYMQILANQAPIGFEAEFVNQRGNTVLYRGILLPYSSDDDTIDFIYGVINWKEMADAVEADELLLEIDQALEESAEEPAEEVDEIVEIDEEDEPVVRESDPVTDWADGPGFDDSEIEAADETNVEPLELTSAEEVGDEEDDLPTPAFGEYSLDDEAFEEDYDDEDEANYSFASLTDHVKAPANKPSAIDLSNVEASVEYESDSFDNEDWKDSNGEGDAPAAIPEAYEPEASVEPVEAIEPTFADDGDDESDDAVNAEPTDGALGEIEDLAEAEEEILSTEAFEELAPEVEDVLEASPEPAPEFVPLVSNAPGNDGVVPGADDQADGNAEDADLFDCLASARELAQTARSCEDRSRSALYAAVGRAYDFSIAAQDSPADYDELVAENGLTIQDRAPMTPVVKLVFGADYDKTRLTEYAAVLSHAHRVGIERGKLADFLGEVDGGLKGVVNAERRLRREESGKPVEPVDAPRAALAKKLRNLDTFDFEDLDTEGPEFGLVMIRRMEDGSIAVLGEINDDIPLVERAGRKLLG